MSDGALSAGERLAWLRLARSENVGPVTFRELVRRYGSASKALEALPELSRRGGRSAVLRIPSARDAEAEIAAGEALGAQLIATVEAAFPLLLAALDPPPPLIWARGRVDLLAQPAVAIVGARIASAAGQRFARGLASELGQAGYAIVSGMARGIDAAAHEGSMATGTIAVLAGGVDDVYPSEHQALYARLATDGVVISESPPGMTAQARDFPRRNRLIAGLARAVVVVEAEMRSGSLITARLAAEQGREVLAVPGSPLDPRAKGTNDLIRQGAAICESADDVLRVLEGLGSLREPTYDGDPGDDDPAAGGDLRALRERIAALLSPTPTPRDELVRATGASAAKVMASLMELTLSGRAELLPGGLAVKG